MGRVRILETAVEEAVAAKGPPLDIAVLVSSRRDVCFDPGDVAAIKAMATAEQERINLKGGIGGRPGTGAASSPRRPTWGANSAENHLFAVSGTLWLFWSG